MPIFNQSFLDPNGQPSGPALRTAGATFPIEVQVPSNIADVLNKQGKPIPTPITGMALIDTGASRTAVHKDPLAQLGLNPVSLTNIGTASGPTQAGIYAVSLWAPTYGIGFDITQVVSVDLSGQVIQTQPPQPLLVLLGRDILERFMMVWNGPAGMITLAT